jgi:hypothetical protein
MTLTDKTGIAGRALALLIMLMALGPTAALAQSGAAIGPNPAAIEIGEGQVGSVALVLENIQGAYGIDLQGRFDPAVLEIAPAEAAAPLIAGGFIHPDFVVVNRIDNTAGTFRWAATQVNPSPDANGSGPVIVIQFRGKARGQTARIELTRVEVAARSGMLLPVSLRSGTVTVTGANPAPLPTTVPTAAPTSVLTPPLGAPPPTPEPVQIPPPTTGVQTQAPPAPTARGQASATAPITPPAPAAPPATPAPSATASTPAPIPAVPASGAAAPTMKAGASPSPAAAAVSNPALPASPSPASARVAAPPAGTAGAALPGAAAPAGVPQARESGPAGTVSDLTAAGALLAAAGVAAAVVGVTVWRRRGGAR